MYVCYCMYTCMCVCLYVYMYVCMFVCMYYVKLNLEQIRMYVYLLTVLYCMYVRTYAEVVILLQILFLSDRVVVINQHLRLPALLAVGGRTRR